MLCDTATCDVSYYAKLRSLIVVLVIIIVDSSPPFVRTIIILFIIDIPNFRSQILFSIRILFSFSLRFFSFNVCVPGRETSSST